MRKAACLLMLVAGCGGLPTSGFMPGRSLPRATLDEAITKCGAVRILAIQVEALVLIARLDRDNGTSEIQAARNSLLLCDDQTGAAEGRCLVCMAFVMDFVYGE